MVADTPRAAVVLADTPERWKGRMRTDEIEVLRPSEGKKIHSSNAGSATLARSHYGYIRTTAQM